MIACYRSSRARPNLDFENIGKYSENVLEAYCRSKNIMIPKKATKNDLITVIIDSTQPKRRIVNFSPVSPKKFRYGKEFKQYTFNDDSIPKPILIRRTEQSPSSPTIKQIYKTPTSAYKSIQSSPSSVSPIINSLAASIDTKQKQRNQASNEYEDQCMNISLAISLICSGGLVTIILASFV